MNSPSRWNQFGTKELKRQEPKGGETAACRLLTIIAGTRASAFGWLRMRKFQLTRPSSSRWQKPGSGLRSRQKVANPRNQTKVWPKLLRVFSSKN
jgi:hypothetical protein